ncbi:conserved hypothetical protein [Mesorhizobium plurifarium]|uniref:Putative endonuclease Z1 domain-containing protein n=1 Tax=Mesorhizobium plurifarium TaxID=69974 RepID=A0A090EAE2_MESPL|nr:conserved hypothetical protein [Mesorhizobium plurifarium]
MSTAVATIPGLPAGAQWAPHVGEETRALLAHSSAPPDSHDDIIASARSILSKCAPPSSPSGQETGLVIGYVQSGKTLSFTTVTALARDNLYPIVIVIAGTTVPLFNQSTTRLQRDLRLSTRRDRRWQLFPLQKDTHQPSMLSAIRGVLADWADPSVPETDKKTVLITVMKHHGWLAQLRAMLASIDLAGRPVLIIDDEADQASLNAKVNSGEQTTTYTRIMELRAQVPHHTFLQYTATPQAPLLINIIDLLSPNFVEVLGTGPGYVGGKDFFVALHNSHVRQIPPADVPSPTNVLLDPPASLLEALRIFMVGVASQLIRQGDTGYRSMLVHPSHRTASHQEFFNWVQGAFNTWQRTLALDEADPDRRDLLAEFAVAYDDLATTANDLPPFDVVARELLRAFRNTTVMEINAVPGKTPTIPWQNCLGWVLVGGQAMDRGFTVEGLTVTYMPRGVGVGNADTVQQRGRFFGYKQGYLGYCRIYLEAGVRQAFHDYVAHEEEVRVQLEDYERTGKPLDDWKRAFILSPSLKPTRSSVLDLDYMRGAFADSWFEPKYVGGPTELLTANRQTLKAFLANVPLTDMDGHPARTEIQKHRSADDLSLADVLQRLLVELRLAELRDSQNYIGALLQISRALDQNSDEKCLVVQMSGGLGRQRGVSDDGRMTSRLFQGANPSKGPTQGSVYPGDRHIHGADKVTVQIHNLDLTRGTNGPVIVPNVHVLAIWIPARLGASWLVQNSARPIA